MIRNYKITERTRKRLSKVEDSFKPKVPPIAIVEPGAPIPEGVKVVIIDNIPQEPVIAKNNPMQDIIKTTSTEADRS